MATFVRNQDPLAAMGIGRQVSETEKKDFLKKQLSTNKLWATHALLKIFEFQTIDEQEHERTCVNNNVGFTGADGEILASLVKHYNSRGFLSPKQMVLVFKKMPKYWKQVEKISDKDKLTALIKKSYVA